MEEQEYREAKEAKSVQMRLTLPARSYDYLTHLKTHTALGASENDIAAFLLVKTLHDMKMNKFWEPPPQIGDPAKSA